MADAESITVCVRIRPDFDNDGSPHAVLADPASENTLFVPCIPEKGMLSEESFTFDRIMDSSVTQEQAFAGTAMPLLEHVLRGVNATVIMYGQTGSGKTHSMIGGASMEERGIIPRAAASLFDQLQALSAPTPVCDDSSDASSGRGLEAQLRAAASHMVSVSMLEVYNEEIRDLLFSASPCDDADTVDGDSVDDCSVPDSRRSSTSTAYSSAVTVLSSASSAALLRSSKSRASMRSSTAPAPLRIVDGAHASSTSIGAHTRGVHVEGAVCAPVLCVEDVMRLLAVANHNRVVARTACNAHSSRSHMMVILHVSHTDAAGDTRSGKLTLVDLAGSEMVGKSAVTGLRLDEAKHINTSLTHIGIVIHALTTGSKHIPYRNSVLTRLLSESLGGSARTCIILTVSPNVKDVSESKSTLRFGTRAKCVTNRPVTHISHGDRSGDTSEAVHRLKALVCALIRICGRSRAHAIAHTLTPHTARILSHACDDAEDGHDDASSTPARGPTGRTSVISTASTLAFSPRGHARTPAAHVAATPARGAGRLNTPARPRISGLLSPPAAMKRAPSHAAVSERKDVHAVEAVAPVMADAAVSPMQLAVVYEDYDASPASRPVRGAVTHSPIDACDSADAWQCGHSQAASIAALRDAELRNVDLAAQLVALQAENAALQAGNATLQDENATLQDENAALQGNNEELQGGNDELTSEIERLYARADGDADIMSDLKGQRDSLEAELADAQNLIFLRDQNLEMRDERVMQLSQALAVTVDAREQLMRAAVRVHALTLAQRQQAEQMTELHLQCATERDAAATSRSRVGELLVQLQAAQETAARDAVAIRAECLLAAEQQRAASDAAAADQMTAMQQQHAQALELLQGQLAASQADAQSSRNSIVALQEDLRIARMRENDAVTSLRDRDASLTARVAELEAQLADAGSNAAIQRASHAADVTRLQAMNDSSLQDVAALRQQLEALQSAAAARALEHGAELQRITTAHEGQIVAVRESMHAEHAAAMDAAVQQARAEAASAAAASIGLLQAEHDAALSEMRAAHEADMTQRQSEHEQRVAAHEEALIEQHGSAMTAATAELTQRHAAAIAQLQRETNAAAAARELDFSASMTAVIRDRDAELQRMRSQHESQLSDVRDRLRMECDAEIAALKDAHQRAVEQLQSSAAETAASASELHAASIRAMQERCTLQLAECTARLAAAESAAEEACASMRTQHVEAMEALRADAEQSIAVTAAAAADASRAASEAHDAAMAALEHAHAVQVQQLQASTDARLAALENDCAACVAAAQATVAAHQEAAGSQLATHQEQLQSLQQLHDERFAALQDEKHQLQADCAASDQLRDAVASSAAAQLDELRSSHQASQDTCNQLIQQLQTTQAQLASSEGAVADLTAAIARTKAECDDHVRSVRDYCDVRVAAIDARVAAVEAAAKQATADARAAHQKELSAMQHECGARLAAVQMQRREEQADHATALAAATADHAAALAAASQRIEALTASLQASQQEGKLLAAQLKEVQARLQAAEEAATSTALAHENALSAAHASHAEHVASSRDAVAATARARECALAYAEDLLAHGHREAAAAPVTPPRATAAVPATPMIPRRHFDADMNALLGKYISARERADSASEAAARARSTALADAEAFLVRVGGHSHASLYRTQVQLSEAKRVCASLTATLARETAARGDMEAQLQSCRDAAAAERGRVKALEMEVARLRADPPPAARAMGSASSRSNAASITLHTDAAAVKSVARMRAEAAGSGAVARTPVHTSTLRARTRALAQAHDENSAGARISAVEASGAVIRSAVEMPAAGDWTVVTVTGADGLLTAIKMPKL